MDLIDQLNRLKGRSTQRRRGKEASRDPHATPKAPDPKGLAALLDSAKIIGSGDAHLVLRRVEIPLTEDLRAIPALLERALERPLALEDLLAIDTETTGLAGGTGTVAFLIGLGFWEGGRFVIEQAFMPDYPDEPALLDWLRQRLDQRRALLSYNGKTFDMPLLRTRWRMHGGRDEREMPHFDVLHAVRRLFAHRLRVCGLANAERALLAPGRGDDDLPGRAAPRAYFRYLDGHELDTMAAVFRHNEFDTVAIVRLLARIAAFYADPEGAPCGDPGDLLGLAEWAEALGDPVHARDVFALALTALRDTPLRSRIELRLAELSHRTGREDDALTLWRSCAERDPLGAWPAVKALIRHHEQHEEWREAFGLVEGTWQRFEQVRALRSHLGRERLPTAWRQWLNECEDLRTALQQAAHEEQLTLF